jgi:hypothetical protein
VAEWCARIEMPPPSKSINTNSARKPLCRAGWQPAAD